MHDRKSSVMVLDSVFDDYKLSRGQGTSSLIISTNGLDSQKNLKEQYSTLTGIKVSSRRQRRWDLTPKIPCVARPLPYEKKCV